MQTRHAVAIVPATAPEYPAASQAHSALTSALAALLLLIAVVTLADIPVIVE